MHFGLNKIIITVFLTSSVKGNEYFKMSKISDDMEEILYNLNSTTITSCQMHCNRESECYSIGLTDGSSKGSLYNCHLLKRKCDALTKHENEVVMIKVTFFEEPGELAGLESLTDIKSGWKLYNFVCHKELPLKSKQLMTIEKLSKQYKMHLEVKRIDVSSKGEIIVYFTAEGSTQKTPYISFHPDKDDGFYIESAVNGSNYYVYTQGSYPLNEWIEIELSQIKVGQDFIYRISVYGKELLSMKNAVPREFCNVQVFIGDTRSEGFIRNLWMMVKN